MKRGENDLMCLIMQNKQTSKRETGWITMNWENNSGGMKDNNGCFFLKLELRKKKVKF